MSYSSADTKQTIKHLFDEYFHQLVLSSFRYVKDYSQSEDIVQDVFVKIWHNFDELKSIGNMKAYLFKAVKNSSLNYLRHQKTRSTIPLNPDDIHAVQVKSAEDSHMDEETLNKIHSAINNLPDHWREVFVMSKYDQLKYHEIATKLNISQKTVEKYISKSLKVLRHQLNDLLLIGIIVIELFFRK